MPIMPTTRGSWKASQPIAIPAKPKHSNLRVFTQSNRWYRIPEFQNSPPQIDLPSPDEIFGNSDVGEDDSESVKMLFESQSRVMNDDEYGSVGYPEYMRAPSPSSLPPPPADWGSPSGQGSSTSALSHNAQPAKAVVPATSTSWSRLRGVRNQSTASAMSTTPDFMRAPSPSSLPAPTFDWPSQQQNCVFSARSGSAASSMDSDGSESVLVTSAFGGVKVVCPRPSRPIQIWATDIADLAVHAAVASVY